MVKDFSLASGHSAAASLQNIENLFISLGYLIRYQPRTSPVTLGSVDRVTLDQQVTTVGVKIVTWRFGILPFTLLSTLVTTFGAGWSARSGNVTIRTLNNQYSFANYNAVMVTPEDGRDFERRYGNGVTWAVGVEITFRDLTAL